VAIGVLKTRKEGTKSDTRPCAQGGGDATVGVGFAGGRVWQG
jgi:hypothetical protein